MKKPLFTTVSSGQATALGLALLVLFFSSAQAGPRQVLRGHVPPAVANLTPLGRLPATNRLHLAIGLPLRNQAALEQLLPDLYNPASPRYRQYLTPAEFTEQFGPSTNDYQALIRFLTANGLAVSGLHPNRVILDVAGQVGDIERVFQVTLRVYQHPKEQRSFYAPDTEPSIGVSVPILDVSGLDTFSLPRPKLKPKPAAAAVAPKAGSGPGGSYRGNDFRAAYVPGTSLTGLGQSVGLLQFDGYFTNAIAMYASQAGLPYPTLVNVPVDGGVPTPGSGNSEVSLDIEMVMSMAPAISTIYVYEAPNPSPWVDLLSKMANDNLAKQLSCSWGGGSPDATAESIFKQMAAQGQSFFNASGDSDAFTGSISFPSDSTNITQVGGTTLTTGTGGAYVSETVWNWGNGTGSSGGISTYYGIPSYQQGIDMTAAQGSTTMRNVPDVALTGDNVYVVYTNGVSGIFGGTSCAAPLWAGLTALINQQAAAKGVGPVGFLNPALYRIGKSSLYATNFHDITNGNNFSSASPSKFAAANGYDLCTGWGTPNGQTFINTLTGPWLISNSVALVTESCTNGVVDPGETVTMNFGLANIGLASTTNLLATLLVGGGVSSPSGSQVYGAMAASGGTVARPFTFTANGTCGSIVTATLQLQDGTVNLGTIDFTIPLGQLNAGVVTFAESFDGVTAPALPSGWTTTAGGGQVWSTSTSSKDTAPNAMYSPEPAAIGANELVSPPIPISSSSAQLSFQNYYNLKQGKVQGRTTYYDGGVLEIQIGNGAFADILTAGGSFVSGPYNHTINSSSNPLNGRRAWTSNAGGFITTTVNLPASAAGQNIRLKWRCATDGTSSGSGWYIDSLSLTDSYFSCCSSAADVAVSQTASPASVVVGSNLMFTLSITNGGPQPANNTQVTDTLPPNVAFVSASPGCTYSAGQVTCALGTLAVGASTNLSVTVQVLASGTLTNTVMVTASGDTSLANNTSTLLATALSAPQLSVSPASLNFGYVAVGQTVTQNWMVVNTGQAALSGSALTQAPFAIVSGSPFTLNGGQTGLVALAFSPLTNASYSGSVAFSSNGGNATNAVSGAGAYPVVPGFSATPTSGAFPLTVTFTDSSTGTITNRTFDFGDGTSTNATATTVQHTYVAAGTNTVVLTIFGPLGSATQTKAGYIVVTNPPSADLALGVTATPEPVFSGKTLVYTLTVTNLGPQAASAVTVTNTLAAEAMLVSASGSQGTLTNYGQDVVCSLGALSNGAIARLVISVTPSAATNIATLTNQASVFGLESDPNMLNNVVQTVSTVWLDSVGDNVPNWWRATYFGLGNTTNSVSCAACDPDGDGVSNLAEFLADTNPTNSASFLKLTGISPVPGGLQVQWQGGTAARQFLQGRLSLVSSNQTWVDLFTNLPPTPPDNTITNGFGTNAMQFFRIRAVRP